MMKFGIHVGFKIQSLKVLGSSPGVSIDDKCNTNVQIVEIETSNKISYFETFNNFSKKTKFC